MSSERLYSQETIATLNATIERSVKNGIMCCPNCDNFDAMGERCKLNSRRPPASIIAFGCECFKENGCPF